MTIAHAGAFDEASQAVAGTTAPTVSPVQAVTQTLTQAPAHTQAPAQVPAQAPAQAKTLPASAQREVERLTEVLFFPKPTVHRRSVLMIDMDSSAGSSLWLAKGVGSTLGGLLRRAVYVLSVSPGNDTPPTLSPRIGQALPTENYFLEHIAGTTPSGDTTSALTDRLAALQAEAQPVIVHLSHLEERAAVLARADTIEGVILLIHASRTRRAALEAMEHQLSAANLPLLGSVLLDRTHPIPEKLYKLL